MPGEKRISTCDYGFDQPPPHSPPADATKAEALVRDYHDGQLNGIDEQHRLQPKLGTSGSIAIAYLIGASWVSLIGTIDTTMTSGGNSCIFWGLFVCVVCSLMSVMSLSECSSLWPVGNQEVWAYHLARPAWKRVSAHQSGWALTVGYVLLGLSTNAVVAQVCFFFFSPLSVLLSFSFATSAWAFFFLLPWPSRGSA